MVDEPGVGDEHPFDRVRSLLLDLKDVDSLLSELARLAAEVVASTSCGITVRYDGSLLTVGSSDAWAEALDETQYRSGDGPCLESLRSSRIVEMADLEREGRWPQYLANVAGTGLRCSLSLPLVVEDDTIGALNVYGFDRESMFAEPERRLLELFAARVAGTLQVARRLARDSHLLAQMDEALNSRSVIDQALGIIMGQQRTTSRDAFELLRRESQNSRRRLRDVAADLVERTTGRAAEPGRDFGTS